jgi:hypothetical protein
MPEYRQRADEAIFQPRSDDVLSSHGPVRLEANYILEDNPRVTNAVRNLGLLQIRRYRVCETPI